ncbi:MAG: UDP-N-acetylmuramate dehydrogenase [Oscillospiraceae bacterium]|nr:UDP-N-acetylmuramate dehydrogenase [Oscillospiraceae bacterium]
MNHINTISDYCKNKRCIVKINESLKDYTTFKIGGNTEVLVLPQDKESLIDLIRIIKENNTKYVLIGNGSNVLISENHFDGAFIITSGMNGIMCDNDSIYAECGATLNRTANFAKETCLSGLEFAYGIPGTVGGAVYMNAGAYGGQMSDVLYSSDYLDTGSLEVRTLNLQEHEFAYRKSIFDENNDYIILSSVLKLKRGEKSEIEALMAKNIAARKEKQPLEYPSAGSVFKRGNGYYTAKLIEDCGLKGCQFGGAQVSEKHAGFIINKGGAKFSDVVNLIEHIKSVVLDKTGINIECEVKIINF